MDKIIELLKYLIPMILSSGVFSYLLLRKSHQEEKYREIINDFTKRTMEGINEVLTILKETETIFENIQKEYTADKSSFAYVKWKQVFSNQYSLLGSAINRHRVYISPLINYRDSKYYSDPLSVIIAVCSIFENHSSIEEIEQAFTSFIVKSSDTKYLDCFDKQTGTCKIELIIEHSKKQFVNSKNMLIDDLIEYQNNLVQGKGSLIKKRKKEKGAD